MWLVRAVIHGAWSPSGAAAAISGHSDIYEDSVSYATLAEFKAWTSVEDANDDVQIQTVLDAATRSIDRTCGRHFTLETGVTKLFYASDPYILDVVDLISTVPSISIDINLNRTYNLTLTAADYELRPYSDEAGYAPVRFQQVRIWPYSSHLFQPGRLVRVIGDFGYVESGATPTDVKQACLILSSRLWKRRETPFGVLGVPDMGTVVQIRKTDPDVASLLEPYIRGNAWVAV